MSIIEFLTSFLIPLFFIILYNGTFTIIFKNKFGKILPISLIIMTMIEYFSQMIFGTFNIGFIINVLIAVAFPIILIIMKLKHKNMENIIKNALTTGLYTTIIIYVLFYIFNFGREFYAWDEFSHWGQMVKELLRLDKFYSIDNSHLLVHKDYLPFIQVFEMLWCKLSLAYSEGLVTFSLHFFSMSLIVMPIVECLKEEKAIKKIIIAMFIFLIYLALILTLDKSRIFKTIYIDVFIALQLVYAFILIYSKDVYKTKSTFICLIISLTAILLTKQIGIAFFMLLVFYYILNLILNSKINKDNKYKEIIKIILLLVIPIIIMQTWSLYINQFNIEKQFDLKDISIKELINILTFKDTTYKSITYKNFIEILFGFPLTNSWIPISYILAMLIVFTVMLYISIGFKNEISKKEVVTTIIICILGAIGYAFTLLTLYFFSFSSQEAMYLASIDRYLSTYVIAEILIVISILIINIIKKNNNILSILIIIFLVSIIICPSDVVILINRGNTNQLFLNYANTVLEKTENDSKIFILSKNNLKDIYYINYLINGQENNRTISSKYMYYNLLNESFDDKMIEQVQEEIRTCDYIYVIKTSENFDNIFEPIFNADFNDENLYKIIKKGNNFECEIVE